MNKTKILGLFMFLLVFAGSCLAAAPTVVGLADKNVNEDSGTSVIYTQAELNANFVDEDPTPTSIIIVSQSDTSVVNCVFNAGDLECTPQPDAVGDSDITLRYTDSEALTVEDVFKLTVNPVSDAPEWDSIPTQSIPKDEEWDTFDLSAYASDADVGDTLTFALVDGPTGLTVSAAGLVEWTPSSTGKRSVDVSVTDGSDTVGTSFSILVEPNYCSYGELGELEIDVDIDNEDDDFYPGDTIDITVDVENNYDDDDENDGEVEDIVIELFLYDLDDGDELDDVESESFDLDAGDDDSFDFELEIPSDVDEDNEIRVFVVVYEDGDKDKNCQLYTSDELDVKRQKHDVDVDKFSLLPSHADPGDIVTAKVEVENIGARDEDDVTVEIRNSVLGISQVSNPFDLDQYGKSDSDNTVTFTFTVPEDAKAGTYSIEAVVLDEDGDAYDSGNEFLDLVISSSGSSEEEEEGSGAGNVVTSLAILTFNGNIDEGQSVSVPVKITNDGSSSAEYTVEVVNIDDWAEPVSSKMVNVAAGQSVTEYMYLKAKEGVAGKHSATINVKLGNEVVASQTALVDVAGEEAGESFVDKAAGVLGNSTFLWIAGDIVLILLAIWFIKMLFTKKH